MSTISVIIPVHKPCKTLLNSVKIMLKGGADEILIVAVRGAISRKKFSSGKKKVRIIWVKSGKGPSYYRNIGIKKAQSDILLFFDSPVKKAVLIPSDHSF